MQRVARGREDQRFGRELGERDRFERVRSEKRRNESNERFVAQVLDVQARIAHRFRHDRARELTQAVHHAPAHSAGLISYCREIGIESRSNSSG